MHKYIKMNKSDLNDISARENITSILNNNAKELSMREKKKNLSEHEKKKCGECNIKISNYDSGAILMFG